MLLPQVDDRICPDPCAGPCANCPDRIVCRCQRVTEGQVLDAIEQGVDNLSDLRKVTRAGTGCLCCHRELRSLLAAHPSPSSSPEVICSAR
jgi:assimilatory nitrate reductase electron transfer subunit